MGAEQSHSRTIDGLMQVIAFEELLSKFEPDIRSRLRTLKLDSLELATIHSRIPEEVTGHEGTVFSVRLGCFTVLSEPLFQWKERALQSPELIDAVIGFANNLKPLLEAYATNPALQRADFGTVRSQFIKQFSSYAKFVSCVMAIAMSENKDTEAVCMAAPLFEMLLQPLETVADYETMCVASFGKCRAAVGAFASKSNDNRTMVAASSAAMLATELR